MSSVIEVSLTELSDISHEIDRSLLDLLPDEEALLKSATGITDEEKLKQHIYTVQEEACKVCNHLLLSRES